MEKIIEIDLNDKYDFLDKYNEKKMSNEMLEYIIKQAMSVKVNEKVKIIINNKCNICKDCAKLIRQGLKEEYNRSLDERNRNNVKQFIFLILGVIFIFFSTQIKEDVIWKEVLLITGWVPIWEMIEVELFPDMAGRRKRRIIQKLFNSEIIEKNIEEECNEEITTV